MKAIKIFFFLSLFSSFTKNFAQTNQQISVVYGFLGNELVRDEQLTGGPGFEAQSSSEFGFKYALFVHKKLRLELGLNQINMDVKINPEFMGTPVTARTEKLKMISIPVLIQYDFLNYLFVNGGLLFDFQKKNNSFDSQSGIGMSLGFGAAYKFKQFSIFVNPIYKRHAIVPFNPERFQQRLNQLGIVAGVGYAF